MAYDKTYYVYILASRKDGALYIGVTGNLVRRVAEHKEKSVEGHTSKYNITHLVHYENTSDVHSALEREKVLKRWKREWKVRLIEEKNPEWSDLYYSL